MTDSHAKLYNALPSINEARDIFSANTHIIPQLWPLLRKFEGKFGVCLVHRHCTLLDKEHMVADGPVTEPLITDECHPISCLKTGEPFEFSLRPTECPPDSLLSEFRQLVGELSVLGIFYIPEEDRNSFRYGVEHTRGRKNIMCYQDVVTTAWRLSGDDLGSLKGVNACNDITHLRDDNVVTTAWRLSGDDLGSLKSVNVCNPVTHNRPPPPPPPPPRDDNVVTTAWRLSGDDLGSLKGVNFCTNVTHHDEDEYELEKPLSPTIFGLTSKTLTAMQQCASFLPRMCVLVAQLDDSYRKWTETKLDVPADAINMEINNLLGSLTEVSADVLYISIVSLEERFKSHGVRFRGVKGVTIRAQVHTLDAQLGLLSKQVSALGDQMEWLPNIDPAATGLRELGTQFAMVSNLVEALDGMVRSVLVVSSRLVASLKENTGSMPAI